MVGENLKYNQLWRSEKFNWRRLNSENYNIEWIKKSNLIYECTYSLKNLENTDSNSMQIVWLRNIDRLIDMTPIWFDPLCFTLLDIGCGIGISTLYFYDNYEFKNYLGFDFIDQYIKIAKENFIRFSNQDIKNKSNNITFFKNNANNILLENKPYFIFLFNPFGLKTFLNFIKNNLKTLNDFKSIIAISNDIWIEEFISYGLHKDIVRNPKFNLSLIFF